MKHYRWFYYIGTVFFLWYRIDCRKILAKMNTTTEIYFVTLGILCWINTIPDNQIHGANMGPTWVLSAPDGPLVGPTNLAIRDAMVCISWYYFPLFTFCRGEDTLQNDLHQIMRHARWQAGTILWRMVYCVNNTAMRYQYMRFLREVLCSMVSIRI